MDMLLLLGVLVTLFSASRGQVTFASRTSCPSNCRCISGSSGRLARYHSMYNEYIAQKMYKYDKDPGRYVQGREMTCLGLLTIPTTLPTDLVKLNIYGGRKGLINPKEENVYSDEPFHAGSRGSAFYQITDLPESTFQTVPGLQELVVSGNRIREIRDELKPLQKLEKLSLRKNQIQKINENSLNGLDRLQSFNMENNFVTKLPRYLFHDTVNLNIVKLGSNMIGVQGIHRDTFITLFQMRILDLSDNQLSAVHPDIFRGNRQLQELNLSNNKLRTVERGWFSSIPGLKKLNLKGNLLISIRGIVFKPLRLLNDLNLAENHLSYVHRNIFLPLPKLEKLDLSKNDLHVLASYTFADLGNLDELNLGKNKLKKVSTATFVGLGKLKKLSLSENNLKNIPSEVYQPLRSVRRLDLSRNLLRSLKSRAFFGMHNIRELYLENNEISSIDSDALLVSWLRHYSRLVWLSLQNNKINHLSPNVFRSSPHIKHLDLGQNELYDINENSFRYLRDLSTLKLEHNQISELPENLFQNTGRLQLLHLEDNKLLYIPVNVFMGLYNVEEINLSNNRIMSIPDQVFTNASALVHVDISNNNLRSFNMDMFTENRNLRRVNAANSSISEVKAKEIPPYKLDYLDLSDNKIRNLGARLVSWLNQNSTLQLGGNPLTCDCRVNWINDAIQSHFISVPDHEKITCKTPVWTAGRLLSKMTRSELICIRPQAPYPTKKVEMKEKEPEQNKVYCTLPKRLPRRILEEWHATVFDAKRKTICDGVRIAKDFILTHASCWKYHGISTEDVKNGNILIKTGSERDSRTAFVYKAKKVIFHPQMAVSSRSEYRAIALVHVESLRPNSESRFYPCISHPGDSVHRKRAPVYYLTAKSETVKPRSRIKLRTITTRGILEGACDGVRYACTKSLLRVMPPWRYLTESAPLYDRTDLNLVGIRSMRQTTQFQTFIGLYDVADWIYNIVK